MRLTRIMLATVALVAFTLVPAAAQERQGFWISGGGGWGSLGVSADEIDDEREGSGVGFLRGGWTLTPQVLLGAELNAWSKAQDVEEGLSARLTVYNLTAALTYYPQPMGGFFVKAGVGGTFADTDLTLEGTNISVELGRGVGLIAGVGYDVRLSRRLYLTPAVNFWYGRLGDVQVLGETVFSGWSHNVVDITVGLTFH
jgi:hypothetical protein